MKWLLIVLFILGCGKKQLEESTTEVVLGFSNYQALVAGFSPSGTPHKMALFAERDNQIVLVKEITGSTSLNFPSGPGAWKFYLLSWNYTSYEGLMNSTSQLYCGFTSQPISLNGGSVTVNLTLSKDNCSVGILDVDSVKIYLSTTTTGTYVKWVIVGYDLLGQLGFDGEIFASSCLLASNTGLSSFYPIPKNANLKKINYRLVAKIYRDSTCAEPNLHYSLIFNNSLKSQPLIVKHQNSPVALSNPEIKDSAGILIWDGPASLDGTNSVPIEILDAPTFEAVTNPVGNFIIN